MIKALVKNNCKDYKDYLLYNTYMVNKKFVPSAVFGVAGLAILILAFILGFEYEMLFFLGAVLILFSGLYALLMYLAVNRAVVKTLNNSKNFTKIENEYTFSNEESFIISTKLSGKTKEVTVNFSDIKKVYELKNFFYLYVAKNVAYIVDKRNLSNDMIEELQQIILKAMGAKKYRTRFIKAPRG